jgi:hypothetical protein
MSKVEWIPFKGSQTQNQANKTRKEEKKLKGLQFKYLVKTIYKTKKCC